VLGLALTLVIWVVPFEVTLKSLKVNLVIKARSTFSEKVAVRLVEGATPVALAEEMLLVTLGAMVSGAAR
jgi:hypothetical protein